MKNVAVDFLAWLLVIAAMLALTAVVVAATVPALAFVGCFLLLRKLSRPERRK